MSETTESLITKSKKKFGDSLDYSKTIYNGARSKSTFICKKHGEFQQIPAEHLKCKIPCPRCGRRIMDLQAFLGIANEVHKEKYDYSKITEINSSKDIVTIICKEHGEFQQEVNSHLRGRGCPVCAGKRFSLKEFVKKANKVWNNKYDYSKTVYKGYGVPINIICPEHGEFSQLCTNHLKRECGCLECQGKPKDFEKISSTEVLLKKAKAKYGDFFDYSKTEFINSRTKIIVTCPNHGDFQTLPRQFLLNDFGCPLCNDHSRSHGEVVITNILTKYKIPFRAEVPLITNIVVKNTNNIRIDFLVTYNNKKYFIEFHGQQHYKYSSYFHENDINNFYKQQKRDQLLRDFCSIPENNIQLLEIKYDTKDAEIEEMILKFIDYKKE